MPASPACASKLGDKARSRKPFYNPTPIESQPSCAAPKYQNARPSMYDCMSRCHSLFAFPSGRLWAEPRGSSCDCDEPRPVLTVGLSASSPTLTGAPSLPSKPNACRISLTKLRRGYRLYSGGLRGRLSGRTTPNDRNERGLGKEWTPTNLPIRRAGTTTSPTSMASP